MKVKITPSNLSGTVRAPSSKSEAHRYLVCAALADAPTDIVMHSPSDDVSATADCLRALGAHIDRTCEGFHVVPVTEVKKKCLLLCRESGTTLRFMLPIAASLGADADFSAEGRLPERPLEPLSSEMARRGALVTRDGNIISCRGRLCGNDFALRADISSQFISGILLASPLLGGVTVRLDGAVESLDYIRMTLDVMRRFGIESSLSENIITVCSGGYRSPETVSVSGDWSGCAFWICAGAASRDGITCTGVDHGSAQGDRCIVDIVRSMGADICASANSVTVKRGKLAAVDVEAADIPDIVPPIAALAAAADGETHIRGAGRLRYKECDRLSAMRDIISSLGGSASEEADGLTVCGGVIHGGEVSSHGDHRIAMSAAVLSVFADSPVTVDGAECVSKSYGAFWDDFESLGGVTDRIDSERME